MGQLKTNQNFWIGIASGVVITMLAVILVDLFSAEKVMSDKTAEAERQPLYWVAPMDANYRRDKPGKSPMGMDLVPVYADSESGAASAPGTVKIAPEVVNNLGVRTASVVKRELHSEIKTVGYVQYDEDKLVHIHPRVEGWIEKLYVKAVGDPVKAGQPLYEIYSPALVNAQEEMMVALERNNSRLIRASEERLSALQISPAAIQQLKTKRNVSQRITFYAPQSGVVDNLNIRQGFFVKPGTTLMSIGALDQVWVEAEIFERQVPFVKTGTPVTMTLDYLPGEDWHGQVEYIYPTLDAKTRTVKLRLKFDNRDDLLKPNMFAQVIIHTDSEQPVLTVPQEAVIRTGNQDRVVLALGEGQFRSVAVRLGAQDGRLVEILEGLSEGMQVVTSAQFLLDSESSKSADFKRMQPLSEVPTSVWVKATIESIDTQQRQVSLTHEAIDKWDWPAMTMTFAVADNVDIGLLVKGQSLHVELSKLGGDYRLSDIHIMSESQMAAMEQKAQPASATVDGTVNRLDREKRVANISRGVIEKWGRAAATLDFKIDPQVDISKLSAGEAIHFTFEIRDGDFVVTELMPADDHAAMKMGDKQ